jgi:hypothetical protein
MRKFVKGPTAFVVGFAAALLVAVAPAALANHKPNHKAKAGEPRQGTQWRHCSQQVRPFVTQAEVRACTSRDGYDPENPNNEVIVFDTKSGTPQWIARLVKARIRTLDNQLEFKYYMAARTCGGGSPRMTLLVSTDGDKAGELVLDGHVTANTCVLNQWFYEDLTNNVPRWSVRALPGGVQPPGTNPNILLPWDVVEALVEALPSHTVLWAKLVEDSQSFMATNRGCAYYDVVSAGARTITDHSDTAGRGRAPNTCPGARW